MEKGDVLLMPSRVAGNRRRVARKGFQRSGSHRGLAGAHLATGTGCGGFPRRIMRTSYVIPQGASHSAQLVPRGLSQPEVQQGIKRSTAFAEMR